MVGFTTRFALLAALSSVAALTVLPTPVRGGLVNADAQDLGPSIAARHSVHGSAAKATADDGGGDDSLDAKHGRKHHKSSGLDGDTPPDSSGTKQQGGHKSLVPLPSPLVSHGNKEPLSSRKEDRKKGERTRKHRPGSKEKHAKEAREVYSIDPMTRMRSLWVGGGMTVRDVQLETLPPHLDKRHHHHHHHHHHPHGSDKVVVKGDDDDVHIHHRFLDLVDPPSSVSDPDDVFVEGTNDDVDVHDHGHDDDDDGDDAVVNGNNDHAHVPRAPRHHHHHPDTVVVKGDDQHVHVHREPSPHHHNHHPDKVVVKGHNDHVHFGRSGVARTRLRSDVQHSPHHRYHPSEVAVKGDHGGVYVDHRALHRRHHHHKTVVEGNHQHVHLGRSPAASPEHHHHHHRPNKVVVKGHHDHVDVHRKRFQDLRHPIVIGGNRGKAYLIPHEGPISVSASAQAHARRDVPFSGVPGTIEIISQDSESKATRIASLVVATPSNGSTVAGSPFVLNASDTDRTQMYMVPASSATNGTSASSSSNSTSSPPSGPPAAPSAGLPAVPPPGSTPPSTGSPAPAPPAGSARRSTDSFVKVLLQTPIFDAASAQLKPYCATFDPRPSSPAPMTVEECMDPISSDIHKSQVFAYEPNTSLLHPMWYAGEDDGTSGDDPAPSAPSAPDSTPSAPSNPPASPSGAPAAPSPPAEPASSPPSPPANSSTPVSNGVPAVTSFEQEALEGEFGDSTHSPVRVPEVFAVEALQNATNVMLMFAPITPEVLPNSPVGKVAELPVLSVSVDPSATSSPADVSTATGSDSTQSVSTSSTVDSTTTTSTSTADASATDSGSSTVVTEQASATPSDASSGDSSSATAPKDLLAAVTPSPTLEVVKVYDVGANDTADGPSGSTTISASGSTATTTTTLSSNSTESDSSMKPTMTPVSTAPYEWMFKGTNASP